MNIKITSQQIRFYLLLQFQVFVESVVSCKITFNFQKLIKKSNVLKALWFFIFACFLKTVSYK